MRRQGGVAVKMMLYPAAALCVRRLYCRCLEAAHRTDPTGGWGWRGRSRGGAQHHLGLSVPPYLYTTHRSPKSPLSHSQTLCCVGEDFWTPMGTNLPSLPMTALMSSPLPRPASAWGGRGRPQPGHIAATPSLPVSYVAPPQAHPTRS